MGRHAGWITAAVGLADDEHTPIPLLLLFPEIAFDEALFLAQVDAKVKRFGYCCIGVSEGLLNAEGKLLAEAGTRDAFGHAQLGGVGPLIAMLIKDRLGHKYHWAVADYSAACGATSRVEDRSRTGLCGRRRGGAGSRSRAGTR